MLKKCDAINSLVKMHSARYLKHTHKFGIECPKTVEDALDLDKQSGNTMWVDAIVKEMKHVQVTFGPLKDGIQPLNGCHMMFDVKMANICQKA